MFYLPLLTKKNIFGRTTHYGERNTSKLYKKQYKKEKPPRLRRLWTALIEVNTQAMCRHDFKDNLIYRKITIFRYSFFIYFKSNLITVCFFHFNILFSKDTIGFLF
jgi:hypothetical protein